MREGAFRSLATPPRPLRYRRIPGGYAWVPDGYHVGGDDEGVLTMIRKIDSFGTMLKHWLLDSYVEWPRDLGMDHFETRIWCAIHRHLYISQLSLLFCSRVHQRLREKNSGESVPDSRAGSPSRLRLGHRTSFTSASTSDNIPTGRRTDRLLSTSQSSSPDLSYKTNPSTLARTGHRSRSIELVGTG